MAKVSLLKEVQSEKRPRQKQLALNYHRYGIRPRHLLAQNRPQMTSCLMISTKQSSTFI